MGMPGLSIMWRSISSLHHSERYGNTTIMRIKLEHIIIGLFWLVVAAFIVGTVVMYTV